MSRPRTLLSLTLIGLGLVTLPLLIGVGTAAFNLSDLMAESRNTVIDSADAMRENERVSQALTDMYRNARQYVQLEQLEPEDRARLLERFASASADLTTSLGSMANLDPAEEVAASIGRIQAMQAGLGSTLTATETTLDGLEQSFAAMDTLAQGIEEGMRVQITSRLEELEQETRSAQRALAWQAGALIPGTLILVGFFMLLVGRPMRQIDRAIRELGKGHFSNAIAISGPADIETLGRQLEWLRLRLRESTEEKNKFLRHMSHELKTPLANIREGTELLLDGSVGILDGQQTEVTGILRENGIKLQRLIENLLTFSAWQAKTAALDITDFELKPFVFSTLSQHRLAISNRDIQLDLDIAPIHVRADEGKLKLVLENLISNAVKFTPKNGRIRIKARQVARELVMQIEDSGPGIPAEERDRVFEAFFQGQRPQGGPVGGTGIGLSVVQECIQAHSGTVELKPDCELGGTCFEIRLPMHDAKERPKLVVANG